jgi:predicted house-cleaning noncanonical NTP pyrophosphatase (MazG superfamily)
MVKAREEESLSFLLDEKLKEFVTKNTLKAKEKEYEEAVAIAKEVILPLAKAVERSKKVVRMLLLGG